MNYLSPASGRHFVVISAGGNSSTSQKGDYVVATFSSAEEIARTPTSARFGATLRQPTLRTSEAGIPGCAACHRIGACAAHRQYQRQW